METKVQGESEARESTAPLYSALVAEDYSLLPLVRKFVCGFTERIAALRKMQAQNDLGELAKLAHKAAGAGLFGFPEIAAAAVRLERAAKQGDTAEINRGLEQLERLHQRALRGLPN